jgi:RNA-directed DNA polymerase
MAQFSQALAPEKTRILEFGRFAERNRNNRGQGKPETFRFLGFTFYCSKDRTQSRFRVKGKSDRKKTTAKLKKLNLWLKEHRRMNVKELIDRINRTLRGYYNYYAVTDNLEHVAAFRLHVVRLLFKWLNRRSQRKSYSWLKFSGLLTRLPIVAPKLKHSLY